uniref:Reverse transcriptase domain-containing protein n=1 Tax=Haemonchus contortus TaxID=6289 RepID=A0A7I4XZY9_HAECO
MLLRFRIPKFVVTSDLEKAFLQVRLHELNRDATRFFWVRDFEKDPEEGNLITYRFTRVTFGLNVSPFLLGATVHFHFRNAVSDKTLEKQIREILYVDNLILAAETPEKAIQKSRCTREIFAEMGMNL